MELEPISWTEDTILSFVQLPQSKRHPNPADREQQRRSTRNRHCRTKAGRRNDDNGVKPEKHEDHDGKEESGTTWSSEVERITPKKSRSGDGHEARVKPNRGSLGGMRAWPGYEEDVVRPEAIIHGRDVPGLPEPLLRCVEQE